MTLPSAVGDVLAAVTPSPVAPPGMGGVTTMLNWLMWGGGICAVVGVIVVGIAFVFSIRRGEGGQHLGSLGWVGFGTILIGAAGGLVGALGL